MAMKRMPHPESTEVLRTLHKSWSNFVCVPGDVTFTLRARTLCRLECKLHMRGETLSSEEGI